MCISIYCLFQIILLAVLVKPVTVMLFLGHDNFFPCKKAMHAFSLQFILNRYRLVCETARRVKMGGFRLESSASVTLSLSISPNQLLPYSSETTNIKAPFKGGQEISCFM